MSEKNKNNLKYWGIFGGSMVLVFCLGLVASAFLERRSEVASIFNNRKNPMKGQEIVARNDEFKSDFPREYKTWEQTLETNYETEDYFKDAPDFRVHLRW